MTELNGDRSAWVRGYRCWPENLEIQSHYDAVRGIDPETSITTSTSDVRSPVYQVAKT